MGSSTNDGSTAHVVKALGRSLSEMKQELAAVRRELAQRPGIATSCSSTPAAAGSSTPRVVASTVVTLTPTGSPAVSITDEWEAHQVAVLTGMCPLLPTVTGGAEPKPAPLLLKDAVAGEFYRNCMARGGTPAGLGKQDKGRAELVMEWFSAMATQDEKLLLGPPKAGHAIASEGDRRRTAAVLQKLVIARLAAGFNDAVTYVPRELGKSQLSATALENRVRQLKALKPPVNIVPTAAAFSLWRSAQEEAGQEEEVEGKRARVL